MQQLALTACLLALVGTFPLLHAVSISYIGDVEIYVNDTIWKCDRIYCPPETKLCRVTKQKLEPGGTQLQRVDTCYAENNEVLQEKIEYEPIGANENISLNVTSYRSGVVTSSSNIGGAFGGSNYNFVSTGGNFDQNQLDVSLAHVDRINQDVQENLRHVNEQIEQQMETLREQLQQNLGNLFGNWG